ncbi:hypothetical protein [Marinobacterium sedimentorum]|uniref:hypothetical protein n=1 Tax=Marinobacterium sedimentorum TaxID=2927804 RepID=UPI0020C6DDDD|nr:hypothetical protein [Marinobacterium sedimentorum]MCP8687947.1 hypothetical protein [Marinobacterium sedimentorum]
MHYGSLSAEHHNGIGHKVDSAGHAPEPRRNGISASSASMSLVQRKMSKNLQVWLQRTIISGQALADRRQPVLLIIASTRPMHSFLGIVFTADIRVRQARRETWSTSVMSILTLVVIMYESGSLEWGRICNLM